jgi:hypothetical protein
MGLFGFGKKDKLNDIPNDFGTPNNMNFNAGQGQPNSGLYQDPLMTQNSGLKLADLNTQDTGFNAAPGVDSFGNPRVAQRTETFDYGKSQQMPMHDNSKDFELILAKLDAIRSEITNINHRLDNIERHQTEQSTQKKYPW